jgi:hypothetical protein
MVAKRVEMLKWGMQVRKVGNNIVRCAPNQINCILKILRKQWYVFTLSGIVCQETRIFRFTLVWSFVD